MEGIACWVETSIRVLGLGYSDSGRFQKRIGYFRATRVLGTFYFDE